MMRMRKLRFVATIVAIACLCAIIGLAYLRMCVFEAPPPETQQKQACIPEGALALCLLKYDDI